MKGLKVSNLNVRNTFAKFIGPVVLTMCGTVCGFGLFGRYPFIEDKDVRYTTSNHPAFAFKDSNEYRKNIYEFERDESTNIGIVKRYNCNFRSYDDLERIVKTANEKGSQILVDTFGEPTISFDPSRYFSASEQEKGSFARVIYSDDKGDFVIENESAKDNILTTTAPVFMGVLSALAFSAVSSDDQKPKSLKL